MAPQVAGFVLTIANGAPRSPKDTGCSTLGESHSFLFPAPTPFSEAVSLKSEEEVYTCFWMVCFRPYVLLLEMDVSAECF